MENNDLRKAGLKVTLPRLKILQIMEEASREQIHHSAEDIYRRLIAMGDDVGLATVYRVLTQFETAGLVKKHYFESGRCVFELSQGEHHDHLVCVRCTSIREFVDDTIENRQKTIASEAEFEMTDHSLIIYGICKDCKQ